MSEKNKKVPFPDKSWLPDPAQEEGDWRDDWRLNGQERYLKYAKLQKCKLHFTEPEEVDHAHCDFCWGKFSENEEDFHVGYVTKDRNHIICEECFHDFKEHFYWTVETIEEK